MAEADVRVARLAGEELVELLHVVAELIEVDRDGERDVRVAEQRASACATARSTWVWTPSCHGVGWRRPRR